MSAQNHLPTRRGLRSTARKLALSLNALACLVAPMHAVQAQTIPASAVAPWAKLWDAPVNVQVGTYHGQFSCAIAGGLLGTYKIDYAMTGAVPVNAGPMQPVYVSQGRSQITVPKALVGLMKVVGGKQISGSATYVGFRGNGATPAEINGATTPIQIPPTALPASGDLVLAVPGDSTLTIGPFTAASGTVAFALGNITTQFNLLNAKGKTILPLTIACKAPTPVEALFAVNFGGEPDSAPLIPQVEADPAVGVPLKGVTAATAVQYRCNLDGVGSYDVPVTLNATAIGLVFKSGQTWTGENGRGLVRLPAQAINDVLAQTPNAISGRMTVTTLEILAENASPAVLNVAAQPLDSNVAPIVVGHEWSAAFPSNGGALAPIPFKAGVPGVANIYQGKATAVLELLDANNSTVRSVNVSCPARTPLPPLFPVTVTK